jgi:integrase
VDNLSATRRSALLAIAPQRVLTYLPGTEIAAKGASRMARVSLTDRFVAGVKSTAQIDYFDNLANARGLALRVSKGGRKTWTLLFTPPGETKRARVTLGTYPATSLAQARTLAIEARGHLEQGQDPRVVLAARAAGAMTVAVLIESFLDKHARPNLRSADEIERRLAKNVTPVIGSIKVADLHRRDVNRVVDPVLKRASRVEAGRVFEDLRTVLRWAVARGDLDHNPVDGMKKPAGSKPRQRILSDDEIRSLWKGLPTSLARSKACQRIIKLGLLTAQRVGEICGMAIAELDLANGIWTIPAERSKNKHSHTVPLTGAALAVIREAIADAGGSCPFVFPGKDRAHTPDDATLAGRFGMPHWTAHDLRRTVVSGMGKLGIPPIVRGHIINHRSVTKAGVTLGVYDHYSYAEEKREALAKWEQHLLAITSGPTLLAVGAAA